MPKHEPPAANGLRALPAVDQLLQAGGLAAWRAALPHDLIVTAACEALAAARTEIAAGRPAPDLDRLTTDVAERLQDVTSAGLRPVINAGGVIIQSNLGRAPLGQAAS